MGAATQEVFTQGNESSKIHNRIGSKVMELCSEEVQEAPEKRMRRQRESAIDMGGEEDALTIKRLGFDFFPRKTRRFVGNESPLDQIIKIIQPNRRRHPVALDPILGQSSPRGRSAPSGLLPLPLHRRLLRALQSRRLFLPHRR